jgi:acetate kinase
MTHYYPMHVMQPYVPQQQEMQQHDLHLLLNAAKTGAAVGATGAAAMNLHRIRRAEIDWQQALGNTVKVGFTAGVATAAAAAVGQMVARRPLLSLVATLATGTAVMYALNDQQKETADE